MKFGNESQGALRIILVLFIAILFIVGFGKGFAVLGILLLLSIFLITSIWVISFLVACIILGGVKNAWSALNPITVIKEAFE